jgi:hypothetical protein
MKPHGALVLPVDSDLAQCAIEHAQSVLARHFADKGIKRAAYPGVLRVSVECDNLVSCLKVADYWGYSLQMKRTYEWDEWSLEWYQEGKAERVVLWSGGS